METAADVEELYRRYHRRVIAFARRRLGDAAEAEDVAQDVFLQLHRSIEAIASEMGRSAGAVRIALRRARRAIAAAVPEVEDLLAT